MSIFVDTSAWYGFVDRTDTSHDRASTLLTEFAAELITTDHVLIELSLLTRARLGPALSETIHRTISSSARIENTLAVDLSKADTIHDAFADQHFSLVDRTSWAVMERLGLTQVVSFDRDFAVYRYGRDRKRAFDVLR